MSPEFMESYEDFYSCVARSAAVRNNWNAGTRVSLPALAGEGGALGGEPVVLAFLYFTPDDLGPWDDGPIFPGHVLCKLRPSGEVLDWETLWQQEEQPAAGRRFADAASELSGTQRAAFVETYFDLLFGFAGPVRQPWGWLGREVVGDLRELFQALAEPPLLPLYRRHAAGFLELLGVAP
jgi:hypothetical protein